MCATTAYKQAALNTMDYIMRLGYSREQARELSRSGPERTAELVADLGSENSIYHQTRPLFFCLSVSLCIPHLAH